DDERDDDEAERRDGDGVRDDHRAGEVARLAFEDQTTHRARIVHRKESPPDLAAQAARAAERKKRTEASHLEVLEHDRRDDDRDRGADDQDERYEIEDDDRDDEDARRPIAVDRVVDTDRAMRDEEQLAETDERDDGRDLRTDAPADPERECREVCWHDGER